MFRQTHPENEKSNTAALYRSNSVFSVERLRNIPQGVRTIEDPDTWLKARGDAYGKQNSKIWNSAVQGDTGITRQHVELIYDVVIRKGLRDGIKVLDLGCGTGPMVVELAGNVGESGEVHGIDISNFQLAQAQSLADAHELHNVHFKQGSPAEGLPYEDDSFDLIVSHIAFQLMPYKQRCLEEVYRVLKPGGLLAMVTDCQSSWAHTFNAPESWCLIFDFMDKHPGVADGKVQVPHGVFPTLHDMDTWLVQIGFVDIDLTQNNPFHRIPPMFNRAYWSVWIDDDVLEPIATHAQAVAEQLMPRLGVTEPRLDVFARKPDGKQWVSAPDQGHVALASSWARATNS